LATLACFATDYTAMCALPPAQHVQEEPKKRGYGAWLLAAALCACITVVFMVDIPASLNHAATTAEDWEESYPVTTASIALAAYVAWILAFLPTTLPELALGFVFGAREGYLIDYTGKLIGSLCCYFLGRTVMRAWLHEQFSRKPTLRAVEAAVASRPYRTAFLLRIAYIPFPLKNYGVAMMGMAPLPFVSAMIIVELGDTYIPIAIGSTAKDLQDLLSGEYTPEQEETVRLNLMLVGAELVVLALALTYVGRLARDFMHDGGGDKVLPDGSGDRKPRRSRSMPELSGSQGPQLL